MPDLKKEDLDNIEDKMDFNKGSLAEILNPKKDFKLSKFLLKILFSDEDGKVIQMTEFKSERDLYMPTILETIDAFLIEPYVIEYEKKLAFKQFKRRIYQMRVSLGRKGREEAFKTLEQQTNLFLRNKDQDSREIK